MPTHSFDVNDPWFTLIDAGIKTVEGRLRKGKYAEIRAGDTIRFTRTRDSCSTSVVVEAVRPYASFEAMLSDNTIEKTLPGVPDVASGILVYRKFYTAAQEKEFGALALCIRKHAPCTLEPSPVGLSFVYWAKVAFAYLLIVLHKISYSLKLLFKGQPGDMWLEGRHAENIFNDKGDQSTNFNDSFYFWGSSADSSFCVTTRLGFQDALTVHPWLMFQLPDKSCWTLPSDTKFSPDSLKPVATAKSGSELRYTCVAPMQQWRLQYKGDLLNRDTGARSIGTFDVTFSRKVGLFQYQKDWDAWTTARAMSAQPWSIKFFRDLRREHQTHYEQGGNLVGEVKVEGAKPYTATDVFAFRDHSFGKRDWTYMQRYVWFGTVSFVKEPLMIDGKAYTHFTFTEVEYGHTFKHLVTGGFTGPGGVLPITGASHMQEFAGEWFHARSDSRSSVGAVGELVPSSFELTIEVKGGRRLNCAVTRDGWKHGFLMQSDTFEVHEGQAQFVVDGVLASGIAEFGGSLLDVGTTSNAKKQS
jgi:ASC-1-like (ASCH) protein